MKILLLILSFASMLSWACAPMQEPSKKPVLVKFYEPRIHSKNTDNEEVVTVNAILDIGKNGKVLNISKLSLDIETVPKSKVYNSLKNALFTPATKFGKPYMYKNYKFTFRFKLIKIPDFEPDIKVEKIEVEI